MLNRFKYIQSLVLVLFLAAWGLQSLSPVVMQHFSHHDDVMMCNMSGDCDGASCKIDSTQECSCSHTSDKKDSEPTLCGCTHHGNEPVGTASPFQIKAPLLSAFDSITFTPTIISSYTKQDPYFIFTDDIFHPPRLNA